MIKIRKIIFSSMLWIACALCFAGACFVAAIVFSIAKLFFNLGIDFIEAIF